MRTYHNLISFVILVSLVFQPLFTLSAQAQEPRLPAADVSAPDIEHEKITKKITVGQPLAISVTATDDTGIKSVILYYRVTGDAKFKYLTMVKGEGSDKYSVEIPKDDVRIPGVEYYIEAADLAGNKVLRGYSFSPLKIVVVPEGYQETAVTKAPPKPKPEEKKKEKGFFARNWIWIGLGVLAAGGLAAAVGGGGGGGGDTTPSTGSVTVGAPIPQ
jgi:hypothetical protein